MDSEDYERKVLQGGTNIVELQEKVRQLHTRVERQGLVILALKELLLAKVGILEDEFFEKLQEVGAQKLEAKKCRKCGKAVNPKHQRCMYCGHERPAELV